MIGHLFWFLMGLCTASLAWMQVEVIAAYRAQRAEHAETLASIRARDAAMRRHPAWRDDDGA